jgi:hypothetical protein
MSFSESLRELVLKFAAEQQKHAKEAKLFPSIDKRELQAKADDFEAKVGEAIVSLAKKGFFSLKNDT